MTNMGRLEGVVARLPQAERVDVEAWDGEPTFRVRGKTFIFSSPDASGISVKLTKEEAAAVVATDPHAEPTGYGLGRHGWISESIPNTGRRDGGRSRHPLRPGTEAARSCKDRRPTDFAQIMAVTTDLPWWPVALFPSGSASWPSAGH